MPLRGGTPLRPALRARHLPCKGRMAVPITLRHSRKGGNPASTWSARPMTSSTSDHVLPSTVVIPAKAGISLLLTKRRKQKRDPSFRWDDGGNPTVRFPPSIAVPRADPRQASPSAAYPLLVATAAAKPSSSPGRGGGWPKARRRGASVVSATPLRPALRVRRRRCKRRTTSRSVIPAEAGIQLTARAAQGI